MKSPAEWPKVACSLLFFTSAASYAAEANEAAEQEQADKAEKVEVITVSARKRDERLQDVPVSIAAFSGVKLEREGITNATDLYGSVPSLYFAANPLSPGRDFQFLTIRGVGANSQLEPSTATFIDGVYQPSLGFDTDFMDLVRVEILRGPQGTLFGRNTQGGALNIVTKKPDDERGGKLILALDEFDSVNVGASVNLPLVDDKLYASFATQYSSTDGFIKNTTLNESADDWKKFAGRAAFRFTPNDDWDIVLRLDSATGKGNSPLSGVEAGCECYIVTSEFQEENEVKNYGGSLSIETYLDTISLTAITGYRELENSNPFDFDASNEFLDNRHDLTTDQSILSQEVRLASDNDDFNWIVGLYTYKEELHSDRQYVLNGLDTVFDGITNRQTITTDRTGWAAFGQSTLSFDDIYELTVGLRYSVEDVDNITDVEFNVPLINFPGKFYSENEETFKDWSPMVSLSARWSEDLMTYATVSKGFKGGGFDRAPASELNVRAVDEETSINYELGLKASLFDQRMTIDTALFHVDIKDQQLQALVVVDDVPFSAIDNAGESHTQGIEFSMTAQLSDTVKFDADIGYTKSEFDEYIDATGADRQGDAFPYVPETTASFGFEYANEILDGVELNLRASYRYVDNYFIGTGAAFDPKFEIDSYDLVNLRATFAKDDWEVSVYVDNVTDEYVSTNRFNAFFFEGDRIHRDSVMAPRKFGLRTSYRF